MTIWTVTSPGIISGHDAAPLTGAELIPVVSAGINKTTTPAEILTYLGGVPARVLTNLFGVDSGGNVGQESLASFPFPAAGSLSAPVTASGLYNLSPVTLPHWRKAVANVRAGAGRGRLLLVGDSTMMGAGAGSGGSANLNGALPKNWPSALSTLLSSAVATSFKSIYTTQNSQVAYGTYDTRVTFGANWEMQFDSLFHYTGGAVNNLAFTPAGNIDSIIVYILQGGTNGTATFNVDGGSSLGTITSVGSGVHAYTASVSKGAHTINIVPNNNGDFYIQGIVAYDSTTPAIDIIQSGQYGRGAADFATVGSPWDYGNHFSVIQPDLSIVCLTINDSNNSGLAGLSSYITNMQTIITNAKAQGDVILMVGAPSNTTQATDGTLTAYISALKGLAVTNNVPLFDLSARWVSYAVTNPLFPYYDTLHPGALGYQDIAAAVFSAISNV